MTNLFRRANAHDDADPIQPLNSPSNPSQRTRDAPARGMSSPVHRSDGRAYSAVAIRSRRPNAQPAPATVNPAADAAVYMSQATSKSSASAAAEGWLTNRAPFKYQFLHRRQLLPRLATPTRRPETQSSYSRRRPVLILSACPIHEAHPPKRRADTRRSSMASTTEHHRLICACAATRRLSA